VIIVVILQNRMELLKGELGVSSKTCSTPTGDGNEAIHLADERVLDIREEEDQQTKTIRVTKTEPNVSCVPMVCVTHISLGCIQN
jgi:hypothetical protein